ncbi:MAG TPA: hypothetical protein DD490_21610 [Acidobacteria bacterium]|nr:hypothetical protein [Acidobacteriota bacterium]
MDPRQNPENLVFGKHLTFFEEPDTIYMRLSGDVNDAEGLEVLRRHCAMAEGRKMMFYLMDCPDMAGLTPGARKSVAQLLKDMPLYGTAAFKAGIKARVIAKLVVTALNLFRKETVNNNPLEFFDTEEEARQWIAERREKFKHVLA